MHLTIILYRIKTFYIITTLLMLLALLTTNAQDNNVLSQIVYYKPYVTASHTLTLSIGGTLLSGFNGVGRADAIARYTEDFDFLKVYQDLSSFTINLSSQVAYLHNTTSEIKDIQYSSPNGNLVIPSTINYNYSHLQLGLSIGSRYYFSSTWKDQFYMQGSIGFNTPLYSTNLDEQVKTDTSISNLTLLDYVKINNSEFVKTNEVYSINRVLPSLSMGLGYQFNVGYLKVIQIDILYSLRLKPLINMGNSNQHTVSIGIGYKFFSLPALDSPIKE